MAKLGLPLSQQHTANSRPPVRWRGPWNQGLEYGVGDLVTYQGRVYVCTLEINGVNSFAYLNGETSGTGTNSGIVVPSTTQVGNLLVLAIGTNSTVNYAGPSGWTSQGVVAQNGINGPHIALYTKTAVSGDIGASLTITANSFSYVMRSYISTSGLIAAASNGGGSTVPAVTISAAAPTTVAVFGAMGDNQSLGSGISFSSGANAQSANVPLYSAAGAVEFYEGLATSYTAPTTVTFSQATTSAVFSVAINPNTGFPYFNFTEIGVIDGASGVALTSPAMSGTPTATTAAINDNSTQVATDAFVQTAKNQALAVAMMYGS